MTKAEGLKFRGLLGQNITLESSHLCVGNSYLEVNDLSLQRYLGESLNRFTYLRHFQEELLLQSSPFIPFWNMLASFWGLGLFSNAYFTQMPRWFFEEPSNQTDQIWSNGFHYGNTCHPSSMKLRYPSRTSQKTVAIPDALNQKEAFHGLGTLTLC